LFDESVTEVLASPDSFVWELAIADHGGSVDAAAKECGINDVPNNAKALWGKSADEARSNYRGYRRKRKKKQSQTPRHKQMNRPARLQSAKVWLQKNSGKNVIRAYRKHFAVDWKCAVRELEMLGVELNWNYVRQVCGLRPTPKGED
jgi:hypothetical protein